MRLGLDSIAPQISQLRCQTSAFSLDLVEKKQLETYCFGQKKARQGLAESSGRKSLARAGRPGVASEAVADARDQAGARLQVRDAVVRHRF
jgi:hypothetical protein